MSHVPQPPDEEARLASLKALAILDTPAEERFDRITRIARRSLGTSIALVSLIDKDRQWFKSAQGLDAVETPREHAFCGHAIMSDETLVVPDATQDERFAANPLVTGSPDIRLYAGRPIKAPDGYRIGTLCVIDQQPRGLSPEDLLLLDDLASLVETELKIGQLGDTERDLREKLAEAERRASIDTLTRVWNRGFILEFVRREIERAQREVVPFTVVMVDIDRFKDINDQHGHQIGDQVLLTVVERMRSALRPYDAMGRLGGDEFLLALTDCSPDEAASICERVRVRLALAPASLGGVDVRISVSIGGHTTLVGDDTSVDELVEAADQALYAAKRAGRNQVELTSGPSNTTAAVGR